MSRRLRRAGRGGAGGGLGARRPPDSGGEEPAGDDRADESTDALEGDGAVLRCADCGADVTRREFATSIQGGFEHRCVNPAGVRYHIGCFGRAEGCVPSGPASTEHTWFRGYAWRIAHCRSCGTHLGWSFESDGDRFFGLILARLTGE